MSPIYFSRLTFHCSHPTVQPHKATHHSSTNSPLPHISSLLKARPLRAKCWLHDCVWSFLSWTSPCEESLTLLYTRARRSSLLSHARHCCNYTGVPVCTSAWALWEQGLDHSSWHPTPPSTWPGFQWTRMKCWLKSNEIQVPRFLSASAQFYTHFQQALWARRLIPLQDLLSGTHNIPPEHEWAMAIFLRRTYFHLKY